MPKFLSWEQTMIEVFAEDQYAIVSGKVSLLELEDALPEGLQYRAPRLPVSLEAWLLSGGVGLLNAPPVRKDVLGLTYVGAHGQVAVGGRVVKNVAGYDAVRLLVGSDSSLSGRCSIETATLRLRPRVAVSRLEMPRSDHATFHVLQDLGAAYAVAYKHNDVWHLRAEFWGTAPDWGVAVAGDFSPDLELHDALGVFPRQPQALSDLETRVLAAL
jgi:FAD/FMN-containing dehydrogenase